MRTPDPAFADPRLAALYDVFDHVRDDLDVYVELVAELGARRVIDVGCGTGSLAVRLAATGFEVVGVDPASASLAVARTKPYADRVTWIDGDATALPPGRWADLALMTGNVAQVFVADADWHATLAAVRRSLRPGGWLAFETRRPEVRDWERWEVPPTDIVLPTGVVVTVSRTVTVVAPPLVTFTSRTTLDGVVIPSSSTLRFRERAEVETDLGTHGFTVADVRDAPDRSGKEWVFLAHC